MKNKVLTKTLAVLIAVMTIFSSTAIGFTASAASVDPTTGNFAVALINTGVGQIPVVGTGLSKALDPILRSAFGINANVNIMNKLNEISEKLDNLELEMDQSTQTILETLYDSKLDSLNDDLTALKVAVGKLYDRLAVIEANSQDEYEKEILAAELLNFDYRYTDDIVVTTEKLAKYVDGTQFKVSDGEGLYIHAYKSMCATSVIGGEAALKAASYISQVNEVLSDSYKLMEIVLAEKIYVADNMANIDALCESNPEFKNAISGYDLSLYRSSVNRAQWSELLGTETKGYAADYNRLFNNDNKDSVVSKYNQMVKDNWFSYIRSTRFSAKTTTVVLVKLNPNLQYTTPNDCGLNRKEESKYTSKTMAKNVTDKINSQLHSALTKDEIAKLCKRFSESELFCKDKNGNKLTLYKALENYGFNFEDIYKVVVVWVFDDPYYIGNKPEDYPPVIATDASCKSNDVNNSTSVYSDETARFDGYNPLADSLTEAGCTYYHYHKAQGCNYREDGDQTPYRLIYFAPAA